MKAYDHKKIERKWQKDWEKSGVYKTKDSSSSDQPKSYVLDMFPYPSGEGLHVGHPKGYIATDIYSRFKRMNGFNVLHPMGWDAFGLPAENFAIKTKTHPSKAVEKNIKRYKEQLSIIGFDYDWEREINTTDPKYYHWTQWIFLQMYKKDLAYQSSEPINWCPSCQTGLANEDLEDGKCERCGSVVEKRPIRQWVLKITDYAERLLVDVDGLDWPESIKESQRNWIGKSEGAEVDFVITEVSEKITIFTTRPDTLFGVTYLVLSPEHDFIKKNVSVITNIQQVKDYVRETSGRNEIDRTSEGREKTGVILNGVTVINPANNEKIPVWVADYVLPTYGTGAVMAVPAHDVRDFAFAKKFGLKSKQVIFSSDADASVFTGNGKLINSEKFSGISCEDAKKSITEHVGGRFVTKYKLRDWVFSRQRYWGEPIPLIHCEKCGVVSVPEKDLPVMLPKVKKYAPTGTGESPLAAIEKWVQVSCPQCDGKARRETNTMPQWAGSCWYYLRYMDIKNSHELVGKDKEKYWDPVDVYVGGAEHATRHLIYARFWHKFLYDIGVVSVPEPFRRLHSVGLILAEDGKKMSKRYGNVVNPDDVVKTYGADAFRIYEMFMGPFSQSTSWDTKSIMGSRRFVDRVWRLAEKAMIPVSSGGEKDIQDTALDSVLHSTIQKVTRDIETFSFNTAISSLMILSRKFEETEEFSKNNFLTFLKLLSPFAPHISEELWRAMGNKDSIHLSTWPVFNPTKIKADLVTIVAQVNSKVRAEFEIPVDLPETEVRNIVMGNEKVQKWLIGAEIKKIIFVKNKLINFVIG